MKDPDDHLQVTRRHERQRFPGPPGRRHRSRKPGNGGDPESSYVARLLHKGPDAFLKKIGEEATEVVMAAKDADHGGDRAKLVDEVADLWFHSMVALAHYGLTPADVIAELERREGTSGIEEKALRKAQASAKAAGDMSDRTNDIMTRDRSHVAQDARATAPSCTCCTACTRCAPVQPAGRWRVIALIVNYVKRADEADRWLRRAPQLHDPHLLVGACCGCW